MLYPLDLLWVVLIRTIQHSEAGQAAVARLCQVLEKTQCSLKRLADQTESEGATLLVNALPLKKRSLAFVCAVLKYNVSPETIDEMINNLREMQTEVQDCLRHLETSLNDVGDLHDFFHRQLRLVRVSISSHISTSTTLTARLQLVRWLENFGGQPGYSGRRGHERKAVSPFLEFSFSFSFQSNYIITPSFRLRLVRTKMNPTPNHCLKT